MRMRGAHHDRVKEAGRGMVGDIAAGPAQEHVILLSPHRGAEPESGHWHVSSYSAGAGARSGGRRRLLVLSAIQRLTT